MIENPRSCPFCQEKASSDYVSKEAVLVALHDVWHAIGPSLQDKHRLFFLLLREKVEKIEHGT